MSIPMASGSWDAFREQLARVLDWEEAHVGFDKAVGSIPADKRGERVHGMEHSLWQLLEHMRLAQKDLLDFCLEAQYVHALTWPDDYWPEESAPHAAAAWDDSIEHFSADRNRLKALVLDPDVDLFAIVPTGKAGQTYLRAVLLVADHNAYHAGQLVAARRALGIWP
jgi:uncharacterized damage-inducible protein DinB